MPFTYLDEEPPKRKFVYLDEEPAAPEATPFENTEAAIAARPSLIPAFRNQAAQDLVPDARRTAQNMLMPWLSMAQAPMKAALAMSAGQEALESAQANPMLALQRGRPQEMFGDMLKGLRGERVGQRGDVMRAAGAPEPLAAGVGVLSSPETALPAIFGLNKGLQAGRAAGEVIQEAPNFLRGNPRGIGQAEQGAHDLVQSVRQGGSLHGPFFERLGQQSEQAWEPMRQVAQHIDQPIAVEDVTNLLRKKFEQYNPQRAQEAISVLEHAVGDETHLSAPALVDLSSELGSKLPKGVLKGAIARNRPQQFIADVRSAIGEVLEAKVAEQPYQLPEFRNTNEAVGFGIKHKGSPEILDLLRASQAKINAATDAAMDAARASKSTPDLQHAMNLAVQGQFPREALEAASGQIEAVPLEGPVPEVRDLRGAVGQARQRWAGYATDRDKLFQILKPGASPNMETKSGLQFIKRAAEGRLTPSEQEFWDRTLKNFPEMGQAFQKQIAQTGGALRKGSAGIATRQFATKAAKYAGIGSVGTVLAKLLLGHSQTQQTQ